MIDRFDAARLKLKRANKHITDVQEIVLGLPNAYRSAVERDEETGFNVIRYYPPDTEKLASELALIIGDAIHNLRTAIEYAYLGVVEKCAPSVFDSSTKFPVRKTKKFVENALKGRKIDVLCPALFECIVTQVKPYRTEDGNIVITCLHDFDVSDKHWLLTPMLQVFDATGIILEDENGREVSGNTHSITVEGTGPYWIAFSRNFKVKDQGKVSPTVVFNEANPFQGSTVLHTLSDFSKMASYIVEMLSKF